MKTDKHECDLQSCFLCTMCLKEWVPAIAANRKMISVKKGSLIFQEGDPVKGIYFIYKGKAKIHKKWGEDKELILRVAGEGAIMGHRGIGKSATYPVSGTALEPVILCYIDLDFFESTLKVNHDLTYKLMLFLAEELQESERNMRNLAHMTVKGRLALVLLTLHEKFGSTPDGFINVSLSRQDLASMAGTTYETVFRVINDFVEKGIVAANNKEFSIIDQAALAGFTNELT